MCSLTIKDVCQEAKFAFLRKCIKQHVLLPSNHRKGMDFDLLLIQQERRIKVQLQAMICNVKKIRQKYQSAFTNKLAKERHLQNKKYWKKFMWLREKQTAKRRQLSSAERQRVRNIRDRTRYRKRKRHKTQLDITNRAHCMILNKSSFDLNLDDKILLLKGLNFAPTPRWTEDIESQEWLNAMSHIRRIEWSNFFADCNNEEDRSNKFPPKLKLQKFSRPPRDQLNDTTIAYTEGVMAKMRNLGVCVKRQYRDRNNLVPAMRKSFVKLRNLVKRKQIVICNADKDGKIVVINHADYDLIMNRELGKFERMDISQGTIEQHLNDIRLKCECFLKKLHAAGVINEDFLAHTVGIKFENGIYRHISGPSAKYFSIYNTAYAYPLFKTHKLLQEHLHTIKAIDIPIRLLQAAGQITTSRVTAFLEYLLKPVSVNYCKSVVDEYCQDTKHYLQSLAIWESSLKETQPLHLVAADVTALYPNLRRELVKQALSSALSTHTNFSVKGRNLLTQLVMFCLSNVVTEFKDAYYRQTSGIVTGDNHSVSVANIAVHYIVQSLRDVICGVHLFKRYIDDILWISSGSENTKQVQTSLKKGFENYGLTLTFRAVSTEEEGKALEFLDVNHITTKSSPKGFITRDYIKPTAKGRSFLNGHSHHPPSVFKSIVFGEAIRMRRLNELDQDYRNSLNRLREKCLLSGFHQGMTEDMLHIAEGWKERFGPEDKNRPQNRIVWATAFPACVLLTQKEKAMEPLASITYKRPPTLAHFLSNFKVLSIGKAGKDNGTGSSSPCGKCALCGNFGSHQTMVYHTTVLKTPTGSIQLRQNLTCRNYGIYVATCRKCGKQYVGQTKNKFSTRWNTHRATWKTFDCSANNDRAALLRHYAENHSAILKRKPHIHLCFFVVFVQMPSPNLLDIFEDKWLNKIKAEINIQKMILPRVR
uniref:Uncharacterized protein LOC108950347 n=1 Tax=Phallusia mammillata TaxID=59560 RepID=A0A6F9DIQ3_9ASCI|nr:uncharacterized protein LOC108950347 [Phallusia mammillata]